MALLRNSLPDYENCRFGILEQRISKDSFRPAKTRNKPIMLTPGLAWINEGATTRRR